MTGSSQHRAYEAAWRVAAQEVGGDYGVERRGNLPRIRVRDSCGTIAAEALSTEAGPSTRVRALFQAGERVSLAVSNEGALSGFFKKLGFVQDIRIGHDAFDRRFVARGVPIARVRELLAPPVADLLVRQPFVDLRVARNATHPPGVAEVGLLRSRIVTDPTELVGMVEIVRALLPRLDPVGNRRWSDEDRLIARISRPGSRVSGFWSPPLLWEGDPSRSEAARLLGETGTAKAVGPLIDALDDPDEALVAESISALAKLGDHRSVSPLVRLLSDRGRSADGVSIAAHAGLALGELGEGDLVRALDRALDGDPADLGKAIAHRRRVSIEMLMRVLDSFDLDRRVHAATALGAVGAREAVDLLRDKTRAMGLRTRLTEAASKAITEIESRASLPRPAEGPDEVDTLPRPAE